MSTPDTNTIKAWSFSRLEVYKNCPRHAKHAYVDRLPQAPRPALANGKEHANERGSRLHEHAEEYVLGKKDTIPAELKYFEDELLCLRIMKSCHPDRVQTEQMWLFDNDWNPLPDSANKKNIWLRIIADVQVWNHDFTHCDLIDYKSGKRERNEVKHGKQLQLYQLAAFMKHPSLNTVNACLWYFDLDIKVESTFTRERGVKYFSIYNDQAKQMCSDTEFNPRPSVYRCKFCPYGPIEHSNKWVNKTGVCTYGVNK